MSFAEYLARFLSAQEVTTVYEVIGGTIAGLIDAIERHGAPRLISMRHEQAAAFAAEGAARMTGRPGVAMATSGPGATNLLTGIASCHFDSTPAVFVTGQVRRDELRGDRGVRQLGFQEADVVRMAGPITKAAWQVNTVDDGPRRLAQAFAIATSGRPGPVLIDVTMDLHGAPVGAEAPELVAAERPPAPARHDVERCVESLARARRPLILAGGGVRGAGAAELLSDFAKATGVPVVSSLMAVDAMPARDPLRVGMIGTYGNRWANHALARSDVLLVLGSRLDIRQTGADVAAFGSGRTIHHVDADPHEINNRITGCDAIVADVRAFLECALIAASRTTEAAWLDEINALRSRWPDDGELGVAGINPNAFMHALSRASNGAAAYVADVGQHQMWAAQSLRLEPGQRFLTSGGMGAMGFALPAAIGASAGGGPIVVIAGDGGFQLNIQELQTVSELGAPLKLVVLDNGSHGMVRQFQETYFGRRYRSTRWGYSAPDFVRVAAAYGIAATSLRSPRDVDAALARLWHDPAQAHLLHVHIDPDANVYPKLAFGRPLTEMEPLAHPVPLGDAG